MRIIARLSKGAEVRFISHLDLQRTLQRALRRARVPMAYSQGFNPHPLLSFAAALSVGVTSDAEWIDVKLAEPVSTEAFASAVNGALPAGLHIEEARTADDSMASLTALTESADYAVLLRTDDIDGVSGALDALLSGAIVVMKKTKSGVKPTDIRPTLISASAEAVDGGVKLRLLGKLDSTASFGAELFMRALLEKWGSDADYSVHRLSIRFADGVK